MFIQKFVKACLTLSMLAIVLNSYAKADEKILCPSIKTIQLAAQKINKAESVYCPDHGFNVFYTYSTGPAFYENNYEWHVGSGHITAWSEEEAISIGQQDLRNVSYQLDTYAIDGTYALICHYGGAAVTAFIPRA